ncbi:dihydroxyacetone kinase subunit DhaL [Planctomycetota bacterium]
MDAFSTADGGLYLKPLIAVIQENKQYLSDIDGLIGDGDHGINMNKGFTLTAEALEKEPGDLSHGFKTLSQVLMTQIGGSMGPLYGMFFKALAKSCKGLEQVDAAVFDAMLTAAKDKVLNISGAQVGDKTLLDVLIPAQEAFQKSQQAGDSFATALNQMSQAAEQGRDTTKDMLAKVGRSSRLGERSRGVIDAGAASCCLILQTLAQTITANI